MVVIFFGGSFDPPHCGHLAIAEAAQRALQATTHDEVRVLFAPVGRQPLKPAGSSASYEQRLAMTRLAIAGHPGFEVCLADAPDPAHDKPNYTIDTLYRLHSQYPADTCWHLLLGADSFRTLHHWHQAAEIPFAASLIVAARPGENLADLPSLLPASLTMTLVGPSYYCIHDPAGRQAEFLLLRDLHYDISATQLRDQIHGLSPTSPHLLPQSVLDFIHQNHLYI